MVRRNMCPETSCPLLILGMAVQCSSGKRSGDAKRPGCVKGEIVDFVKQNSFGIGKAAPDGKDIVHSPPEAAMTRSNRAGPKNQLVKTSQAAVSRAHLDSLRIDRCGQGLDNQRNRKALDVHAQARLMNKTLRKLDFVAK